jgi:Ran GTPase-activating protein (RanGAP) involved in mRNA processing and transport
MDGAHVVYSFASLDQELLGITSPPADVINLGKYDDNYREQDGFRELTPEELRLLAAKVHSSPHVKVLNVSGNNFKASTVHHVAEALVKLTALERINLCGCFIGAEGAGKLAQPLGKLTALQHLYLTCTV